MLLDILITFVILFALFLIWVVYTRAFGAEWVKIPATARKKMLKMLTLNNKDVFYDLGCGDGQLLIEAAPKVQKAIGIEIDPIRFLIAKARTSRYDNVKLIYGNLFKQNLDSATKIAIFLSPETNIKLGKKIQSKGAKVASYKWPVSKLKLIKHDEVDRIYLQLA